MLRHDFYMIYSFLTRVSVKTQTDSAGGPHPVITVPTTALPSLTAEASCLLIFTVEASHHPKKSASAAHRPSAPVFFLQNGPILDVTAKVD